MKAIQYLATASLALGLMAVSTTARADEDERHYQQHSGQYISQEQAAKIAADKVGGRAGEVDFEYSRHRGAYFEVEVFNEQGEHEVKVDAKSGNVLSATRDY